ncbi:hypothetical protein BDV38DRAFT_238521 [Aspergillus pseudotamarii]|uniref:Uncharacterized protein n=1 Tax=Aspergillus pseudotamarii TaxID=132259 RepID=A0A5N6T439_ASPPS|nr:uncharacterized protein BDV38DRAFT_238521 [Aspergillus pseudotamarii]KAE8141029.1 hypothetical protein BDV38DRAFT_238521 [Aspergillus pseudotamarii]
MMSDDVTKVEGDEVVFFLFFALLSNPVLSHVVIAVVSAPATFPLPSSGVACVQSREQCLPHPC